MQHKVLYKSGSRHRESDWNLSAKSSELRPKTRNMKKGTLFFISMVCLVFVIVEAIPVPRPENYDDDLTIPKDAVHYPYAFWFGRPFYEQDDDGGVDTSYNMQQGRRSSTLSYASVGGGWGR